MTKKESAEKIVEQKGCCIGIYCSDCPLHGVDCDTENFSDESKLRRNFAQAYLDSWGPELPPGHPWADEKPTPEETEHPSSGELKRRVEEGVTRNYGPQGVGAPFFPTEAELLNAYETKREFLQLELLWDIRELLKKDLRK